MTMKRFLALVMVACLTVLPVATAVAETVDGIALITQYELKGDSGDGLSMHEAAEYAMKYAVRPTVEVDDMQLVFDSLPMVNGQECYGFTLTDEPGNKDAEWLKIAVGYDGKVYLQDMSSGEYFEIDEQEAEPTQSGELQLVEYELFGESELEYYDSKEGEDGSYRLDSKTADGIVMITNAAFKPDASGVDAEAKAKDCIAKLSGDAFVNKIRVFEDQEYSKQFSYPSYLVSWNSGESEGDQREHLALVVLTDSLTYVFTFAVSAGHFEEHRDQMYKVLDSLKLEEVFG